MTLIPRKHLQCGQTTSDVQHNSVWLVPWTKIWAKFTPYKTCKLGWGALLPKGGIKSEDTGKFYGLKKIFQKALLNYYIQ